WKKKKNKRETVHIQWALWFFKNDNSKTWQGNLQLVTKFDTVEDFWALYSHIQLASKLTSGCDYSPNWNKNSGCWLITLAKQQRCTELDHFWLETLLCLIGEMFYDYSDDVCGAIINIRAKSVYKEHLGLSSKMVIGYQAHADTDTKSGSLMKNRFIG
uniref:Eukaryotic translation initiation factor 4E n=1 Tax=Naja naja TaxID=35670 RepID=A0A8C6XIA2_NAJNA